MRKKYPSRKTFFIQKNNFQCAYKYREKEFLFPHFIFHHSTPKKIFFLLSFPPSPVLLKAETTLKLTLFFLFHCARANNNTTTSACQSELVLEPCMSPSFSPTLNTFLLLCYLVGSTLKLSHTKK